MHDIDIKPLISAAYRGDYDKLRILIENFESKSLINEPNDFGSTALMIACQNRHEKCVRLLLENGASTQVADKNNWTPLLWVSEYGYDDLIQPLINYGADHNWINIHGWGALTLACQCSHFSCVRLLLENNADMNENNVDKMFASVRNNVDHNTLKVLLEFGADVNRYGPLGMTPLMDACECGQDMSVTMFLEHGAAVNLLELLHRRSELFIASSRGHTSCLEALLRYSSNTVDVNQPDENGYFALHAACAAGHTACAMLLLDHGAEIEAVIRDSNENALMVAAKGSHLNCVQLLIEYGSRVTAVDSQGRRAVDLSSDNFVKEALLDADAPSAYILK